MMSKLSPKQERFVQEYVATLNATLSAKNAGYSERTAQEQGSRLLSKVMIQEAIKKAQEGLQRRVAVTQEMVIAELAKIAFDNVVDEETGLPYRDSHKVKSLELLGKHLGMYVDKVETTMDVGNKDGVPFMVDNMTPDERRARIDELNRKRGN